MKLDPREILVNLIFCIVLLFALALLTSSCGAKKVDKQIEKINKKTQIKNEIEYKGLELENNVKLSLINTKSIRLSPIDSTKPSQFVSGVDTLDFQNTSVDIQVSKEKTKKEKNSLKSESVKKKDSISKNVNKKAKNVQKERQEYEAKALKNVNIFVFLLLIISVLAYVFRKKIKAFAKKKIKKITRS